MRIGVSKTATMVVGWLLITSAVAGAAPVTIDYTVWGNGERDRRTVEAFMAKDPDVQVNLIAGGGITGYIDKLLVMVASGDAPDVFGINVQNVRRFFEAGAALPLDSYVARDGFDLDAFIPGSFAYARHEGVL